MTSSAAVEVAEIRVRGVDTSDDELSVALMDGRTISVPLAWYPRLAQATPAQRANWEIAGGGFGIPWQDVDEDLSTEGCCGGSAPRCGPSPKSSKSEKQ